MPYSAKKIPVTCGIDTINEWATFMSERIEEVRHSLMQEGVEHEQWYLGVEGSNIFLLGVIKTNDLQHAQDVARKSKLEVDKYHQKFKRFWKRDEIRDLSIQGASEPHFPDLKLILDVRQ